MSKPLLNWRWFEKTSTDGPQAAVSPKWTKKWPLQNIDDIYAKLDQTKNKHQQPKIFTVYCSPCRLHKQAVFVLSPWGHPALSKTRFKNFRISGSFTAPPSLGFDVSHHQCSWLFLGPGRQRRRAENWHVRKNIFQLFPAPRGIKCYFQIFFRHCWFMVHCGCTHAP